MSAVEKLMERNHRVVDLDGIEYRVHKMTAQLGLEAFGPGALMVVEEGGDRRVEWDKSVTGEGAELMRKVLKVAMISPRLGTVDDPVIDTVTWLTLGDHAPRLYTAVMGVEVEKAGNFPDSSEVQKAP